MAETPWPQREGKALFPGELIRDPLLGYNMVKAHAPHTNAKGVPPP